MKFGDIFNCCSIKVFPKCLLIKYNRTIFPSWKLSSYDFLIQENCRLIIFILTSTLWSSPKSNVLQSALLLAFGPEDCQKNVFWIPWISLAIVFGNIKYLETKYFFVFGLLYCNKNVHLISSLYQQLNQLISTQRLPL